MKKRYAKRQILESIKYWKKQLILGNYKKLNEANASIDDQTRLINDFKQIYTPFVNMLNSNYDTLCNVSNGEFESLFYDLTNTIDDISDAIISDYVNKNKIFNLIDYLKDDIYIQIQMLVNDIKSNECKNACIKFDKDIEKFTQDVAELNTEFQLNENDDSLYGKYLYVTKNNPSFKGNVRKVGASGLKKLEDPYQFEILQDKLTRYNTCVPYPWEKAYLIVFQKIGDIKQLEQELFSMIEDAGGNRYGDRELFDIDDAVMDTVVNDFLEKHPNASLK